MKKLLCLLLAICIVLPLCPVYARDELSITINDFANAVGGKIETFSADSIVTASVTASNPSSVEDGIIIVTAIYNGDTLFDIQLTHGSISPYATTEVRNTYNTTNLPEATSIKVMVWGKNSNVGIVPSKTIYRQDNRPLVFGALQSSADHYAANLDAGMNTVLLELSWNSFYISEGQKNTSYINRKKEELENMRSLGYKVMLGLGTQYTPDWIYNYANSRYKNQYGDVYTTTTIGDTCINAVFNNLIRQKIESYMADISSELGSDFDIVRLGLARYGEIGYPHPTFNGKTNSYWAFDDIAQGKTAGLPQGITVCPTVGWKPGNPSPNGEAYAFTNWYFDALLNYQTWQIDTCEKYFTGEMAMLYPSWGTRTGQVEKAIAVNLNGSTAPEKNGEVQRGFDFEKLIMGLDNPKVIVYCTWIDANAEWTYNDDQTIPSESNNFSPVHYMAYYAKKNPHNLKIMGENTGGGTLANMQLCFDRMKKYDLDGIMWAFENDLYDNKTPVLADYSNMIKDYIEYMN
ncbi:MAG: hypothetical protein PHE51_02550 [Eubacteriales bacterium]|nr:hypothetical protein [Eubacteriales bacterium]